MFKSAIKGIIDDIESKAYSTIQDIALDVIDSLTSEPPVGTPRDTRYARNSWKFDVSGVVPVDKTKASDAAASIALSEQYASLKYIEKDSLKNFNDVWLVNDAFYIRILNEGLSSLQTPAYFVEDAVYKVGYKFK